MRQDYDLLMTGPALLPNLDLKLIELTGEDRLEWLQGQATNDLRGMQAGERRSFCLCLATGQIEAVCDVWAEADRLLIATDAQAAPAVLKRAETMVILEDVTARLLEMTCLSVRADEMEVGGALVLPSQRLSARTWDVWGAPEIASQFPTASEAAYEAARLEAGIPKPWIDYTAKTLPPELGPAFEARHVSYQKGCYTGQEVLMRIHSRGHTNKTWVGLILEGPVTPGQKVSHPSREDAGLVTSTALSPSLGWIAAATVRNEAANPGETVQVGNVKGTVHPMPLP